MHDRPALSRKLAHEGEGDDRLPAPWSAADDDGRLGVRSTCPVDRVKDVLVGVALLVKQDELLSVLNLLSRHGQELLARRDLAPEQRIRGLGATSARSEEGLEVVDVNTPRRCPVKRAPCFVRRRSRRSATPRSVAL